ncbi:Putative peptidyl-tRNA hydrolase [Septoria linicola]|uniref:peptidyl-tRNA hydrolase n=1 Tax=Septoria linicola TaxID=215465 RepID=A0A9Q9ASA5_9PEZI|nr:putative peptidyl-tRNA hydrolase [Septoria linicola]USW51081.1 Putative peptidyl-tRNA hydrolase [Septoria linicola]
MDIVLEPEEEVVALDILEDESSKNDDPAESRSQEHASDAILRARRRSSVTKPSTKSKKGKQKQKQKQTLEAIVAAVQSESASPPTSVPRQMLAAARPVPLLICSIGNPGTQYANTLHSAGHTVLNRLASHLGYTQFSKERTWGNGLVTRPSMSGGSGDWTLWQSTAYMNESGKGVKAAYQTWSKSLSDGEGKLVVVHDELEKPLGAINVKTQQGLSARGHNGLKSIMSLIGNTPFVRVGVGIGRPVSRQSDDVARYVLRKMDQNEKSAIDGSVEQLVAQLRKIESG